MILADESVDAQIVAALRTSGWQVESIAESEPSISDEEVLERANRTSAMLLTADKDFGELVYLQKRIHKGVVLLRLAGIAQEDKAQIVVDLFKRHGSDLDERFTVISRSGVRIRTT